MSAMVRVYEADDGEYRDVDGGAKNVPVAGFRGGDGKIMPAVEIGCVAGEQSAHDARGGAGDFGEGMFCARRVGNARRASRFTERPECDAG